MVMWLIGRMYHEPVTNNKPPVTQLLLLNKVTEKSGFEFGCKSNKTGIRN